MESCDLESIAPYDDEQTKVAVQRLLDYPKFLNNLADCLYSGGRISTAKFSNFLKRNLPVALAQVRTYEEFQKQITCRYMLTQIERSSIDKLTFSGIDALDPSLPYTFVSNHRDIVLDCALLDYGLFFGGFPRLCEMCVGANLMVNQFSKDMFKLNGGITVMRNLPASDMIQAAKALSEYVRYALTKKKTNIWIAQKSGRSKDGIDNTSTAVLKMLYLSYRKEGISFEDAVKMMNIVPVAISYQYDPCDVSKSREVIKTLRSEGVYNKSRYEDVLNLLRGLRKWKGNVHLSVGKMLEGPLKTPSEAARAIDSQIHLNYKLWNTNWFCYDRTRHADDFASKYQDLKPKSFMRRYKGIERTVVECVLQSYANPVVSMLKEKEKEKAL